MKKQRFTVWFGLAAAVLSSPAGAEAPERAIFAAGCFWCVESDFDKVSGVLKTTSGYIGGATANPSYQQVSAGQTGHTEAVEVLFDPSEVDYSRLLDVFWRNVDPTASDHQFCDYGSQYRPGIFYVSPEQQRLAEQSRDALKQNKPFKEDLVVEITTASTFYPAEEYHQDYYQKNPIRYKYYRFNCGRDARLEQLWGARDE